MTNIVIIGAMAYRLFIHDVDRKRGTSTWLSPSITKTSSPSTVSWPDSAGSVCGAMSSAGSPREVR